MTRYTPTGELDYRRARRSPPRIWPEIQRLLTELWVWPDFAITHRPFDWRID